MNERINRISKHVKTMNDAGVRRTLFFPLVYESLKDNRDASIQIRRAKAISNVLGKGPVTVLNDELIIGSMSDYCPLEIKKELAEENKSRAIKIIEDYLLIKRENENKTAVDKKNEKEVKTFEAEFTTKKSRWALMSRVYHDASITYNELQSLIEDLNNYFENDPDLEKYEIGRELERSFKIDYGKDVKNEIDTLPWFAANHLSLKYEFILDRGLSWVKDYITDKLNGKLSESQKEYYKAAEITINAMINFIKRHIELLEVKIKGEKNIERKNELKRIMKICQNISRDQAKNFYEAMQLLWFLHLMMSYTWGSALSFGRFDQYMLKYYENDLNKNIINAEEAKELLCCLWLKVNEPKMRTVQSMTIGGITPEGHNAVNSLTILCLDVIKMLQLPYPNVGIRINKKNPEWIFDEIVSSVKMGNGQPMLMNDDVWIHSLKALGYEDKHANDYYNMGCVEIMIPGKQPNWGVTEPIAFPMLIENIFNKYRGGILDLNSFEEFYDAYKEELVEAIQSNYKQAKEKTIQMKNTCYDPLASLMIDNCLFKGQDMFQDGSELGTHWSFYAYGLGTAADAMVSIKNMVYEKELYSIEEMSKMLENNFIGFEKERHQLMNYNPHYGNDLDEVDLIAKEMLSDYSDEVFALNKLNEKDKYVSTLFGYFFHVYHGEITGATPNGRKKGEAFSDSMGPSQGKDIEGPTKMLNSVLKLDHSNVTGGYALNIKLSPDLVKDKAGEEALKSLITTYISEGGPQIQFNLVDIESLINAQKNPEKYHNIIVRIGGYCEYFVDLDRSLQDEIIKRTIHSI